MKVLVVSQYFPPEPGATQNRLEAFARGLVDKGHDVTVACEQPCHPSGVFASGYGLRPLVRERAGSMRVWRLWVAASPRKTTARRIAFYGTFAVGAAAIVATARRHDVLLASTPPLPGVLAAAAAARARRMPYVIDVRDPWPAAAEALGELTNRHLLRAFGKAEQWLYRSAARVTATTLPFCAHVDRVAERRVSSHVPNGALDSLVAELDSSPPPTPPFIVGYAGNLGIAQGLSAVTEAAERLTGEGVRFVIVGDGPLRPELERVREQRGLTNLELRPSVPVDAVGSFLRGCHALLVPLGAHPMLADFIPSKLYDAMAVGRPAIVAAAGEAASLTRRTGAGLVVAPEDGAAVAETIRQLAADPAHAATLGAAGRRAARAFARSHQIDRLEAVLRDAVAGASST